MPLKHRKGPSREVLLAENRFLRRRTTAESIAGVFRTIVRWGGIVWVASYAARSIEVLAGQETMANIVIAVLAKGWSNNGIFVVLGTVGVAYGVLEHKLRQRAVKRLSGRIQVLERARDPKRTSSGLTETGDTDPGDLE